MKWARDQLVALLDWATKNKLCLDITCTTCGNNDFRLGLVLYAYDYSPDNPEVWNEQMSNFKIPGGGYKQSPLRRGNNQVWLHNKLLEALGPDATCWKKVFAQIDNDTWSQFRTLILESFSAGEMRDKAEEIIPKCKEDAPLLL